MPRNTNPDTSSANATEGHEILHGTSGDKTLQHTKNVAPMPAPEAGDSLPGMGAGGVADVGQGDAEEFGTNEPRKDNVDGGDSGGVDVGMREGGGGQDANADADADDAARPEGVKRRKTRDGDVSVSTSTSTSTSAHTARGNANVNAASDSNSNTTTNDLEQISRHKAEKYVALDTDKPGNSSSTPGNGNGNGNEKRDDALRESGSDGPTTATSGDEAGHNARPHGNATGTAPTPASGQNGTAAGNSAEKTKAKAGHGQGHGHGDTNDLEQVQRRQAEKFGAVNLEE